MVGGLLLLGGLPASGKSTTAAWLLHTLSDHLYNITVIEGDDCLSQAIREMNEGEKQQQQEGESSSTIPAKSGKSAIFTRSREILRDKVRDALMMRDEVSTTSSKTSSIPRLVVVVDNFQLRSMRMEMWRLCRDVNCTHPLLPQPHGGTVDTSPQPTTDAILSSTPTKVVPQPLSPPTPTTTALPPPPAPTSTRWCFSEAFLDAPLSDLLARNQGRMEAQGDGVGCNPQLTVTVDTIQRMYATFDWGLLPLRHSVPHIVFNDVINHDDDLKADLTTTISSFHNNLCDWISSSCFTYEPQCHCERCCCGEGADLGMDGGRHTTTLTAISREGLLHQVDTALRGVVTEVMRKLSDQPRPTNMSTSLHPPALSGKVVSALKMGVLREAQSELGRGRLRDDDGDGMDVCEEYTNRLRQLLQEGVV